MDFNFSKCIKEAANWGSTEYHNICNHTSHVVNWGSMDWTTAAVSSVMAVAALLAVVGVAISLVAAVVDWIKYG